MASNQNALNEHVDFTRQNATLVDPFLTEISQVTLNKNYLPIVTPPEDTAPKYGSKLEHPSYLTSLITVFHAGQKTREIPILFASGVSESLSASFVKENPVGSTYPITAFANTQSHQISVDFIALSDYLPTGYSSLKEYIDALKTMVKPKNDGQYVKGPEISFTLADLKVYGICDSISISYDNLYGSNTFLKAEIQCQITVTSIM